MLLTNHVLYVADIRQILSYSIILILSSVFFPTNCGVTDSAIFNITDYCLNHVASEDSHLNHVVGSTSVLDTDKLIISFSF